MDMLRQDFMQAGWVGNWSHHATPLFSITIKDQTVDVIAIYCHVLFAVRLESPRNHIEENARSEGGAQAKKASRFLCSQGCRDHDSQRTLEIPCSLTPHAGIARNVSTPPFLRLPLAIRNRMQLGLLGHWLVHVRYLYNDESNFELDKHLYATTS